MNTSMYSIIHFSIAALIIGNSYMENTGTLCCKSEVKQFGNLGAMSGGIFFTDVNRVSFAR